MWTTITDKASHALVLDHISKLSLENGKQWKITIERKRKLRSPQQLKLMWMWVDEVAKIVGEETGNDKEDLHEIFKHNWLPAKILQVEGLEPAERCSTKGLNTIDMAIYMDKIYRWATQDMGFVLPLPPVVTEQR